VFQRAMVNAYGQSLKMFNLYKKDAANPARSFIGCLLANIAMVLVISAIMFLGKMSCRYARDGGVVQNAPPKVGHHE